MSGTSSTASAAPACRDHTVAMHVGPDWTFEQLYEAWRTPIFTHILRLVKDREQAEDLTQETFLKAFCALPPQMGAGAQLASWLYRIGTNTAFDALRRRKRIAFQRWQDLVYEPADSEGLDPLALCASRELVRAALGRMPQGYRAALLAYRVDGRSPAEIAGMLGIADTAIRTYLSRATASFLHHYQELGGEVERDTRPPRSRKREGRAS